MSNKKDFHYYAHSFAGWSTGTDIEKLIKKQKKWDKGLPVAHCHIYKVPLPESANYHIDNYVPEVEGLEYVKKVTY